jgi:L-alanine-DL-glutamate epimerase-like enolase superfamily enzyme
LHRLLRNVPAAREGEMSPGSEPGIGISIDWEAVEKLSRRHVVIATKS